jgi:hypothetical protein
LSYQSRKMAESSDDDDLGVFGFADDDFVGVQEDDSDESDGVSASIPPEKLADTDVVLVDRLPEALIEELCSHFNGCRPPFKKDLADCSALAKQLLGPVYAADGLEMDEEWFARIRLNMYNRGGKFDWHQDCIVDTVDQTHKTVKTALIYLTDCETGGETHFMVANGACQQPLQCSRVEPENIGGKAYDRIALKPTRGVCVIFNHSVRHRALPAIHAKQIAQVKFFAPISPQHVRVDSLSMPNATVATVMLDG